MGPREDKNCVSEHILCACASGIAGSGTVEGNVSGPAALLGTGDNVKAVVVEDLTEDSKVIGAIVGSRHVTNVVKTLQQVIQILTEGDWKVLKDFNDTGEFRRLGQCFID